MTLSPSGGIYNAGTQVTLTAAPSTGWQFSGWSGDLSGSINPATITMNTSKNVTATFTSGGGGDYAKLPYSTGFESGTLDSYWVAQSGHANGRIQITTANTPRGSYHMVMDVTTSGTYVTNEAWLRLNLTGESNVDLSFWWKEFGDENHTEDGVFLSDDAGITFVKVHDLTGGDTTYRQINLDIDQLAAANGLSLSDTFVVKFQQHDNYPLTSDGFAFDDINVTGKTITQY